MTFAGNYQGPLYAPHPDIKPMNRSDLQENLIQQILDDMDLDGLMQLAYDYMDESYGKYSDEELKGEVKEYYPHLLEEETDISALEATAPDYGVGK